MDHKNWQNRPEAVFSYTCYREDGSPLYSGLCREDEWENTKEFYGIGHPGVHKMVATKYVASEDLTVDCAPSRTYAEKLAWEKRNGR